MRLWIVLVAVGALGSSSCTHLALERRTVNQASTLTDLQFHQVLDNVAMFACNPDALAWHLKLTAGTIQVTDQGTGAFAETFGGGHPNVFAPTLTGQRGVVNQWTGIPTIEPENLALLQLAYQKALDPLDHDGKLREAILAKICDLAVRYNVVLSSDMLNKAIDSHTRLDEVRKWQLKRKNAELHEQLDRVFDYLTRLSRPISEAQIDNYAHRLASKITEDTRGEARVKLQLQQEQQRVAVQQTRVGVEDEIVRLTREVCDLPYIPRYPVTGRPEHNPHDIEQAQNQVKVLIELAEKPAFATPWVCVARRRGDLPPCICYVGHYCKCGCHVYAGVTPEHLATLRDFTLAVLTLAPIAAQESPPPFPAGGITYSPTIGAGIH